MLNRSHEWLDQVKAEAKEKGLDFYTLAVAKNAGIPYKDVTREQRDSMKVILFGYTYGSSPAAIKSALTSPKPAVTTLGDFMDVHLACAQLKAKKVSERVNEFTETHRGCWIAAFGGVPIRLIDGVPFWGNREVDTATLRDHVMSGLGLSATLTYMNKANHWIGTLGRICANRDHDWGMHWMSASLIFSDVPLHVELAFARDKRFFLSWPVTKTIGERRVFMASASLKDWAKFVSNAKDPDFDEPTRIAMGLAQMRLAAILPEDLEQHFLVDKSEHRKVLAVLQLEGRSILEIGAGNGELTDLIREHPVKEIHAYEIDATLGTAVEDPRVRWYLADAANIEPRNYKGFALISNPPYQLLPKVLELIEAAGIKDVVLLVPASRQADFFDRGYLCVARLNGTAFDPPSRGEHIIVMKGFTLRDNPPWVKEPK